MTPFYSILPGILYSGFLIFLAFGARRLAKPKTRNSLQMISVIVAARNEEKNLDNLIKCLSAQVYPLEWYEIIIVDDRSTDKTPEMLAEYEKNIYNLRTTRIDKKNPKIVGKKNAIDAGIHMAKHEVLAFTDADCSPGPYWLQEIDRHMTPQTDLLYGYSPLDIKGKWNIATIKNFERAVYAVIAAGSLGWKFGITCTATNMVYRKSLYENVHGFSGIGHVRSGDDDLMMFKMMPHVRKVNYMMTEQSYVPAKYSLTLSTHMALETRRASKWKYWPFHLKAISLLAFLFFLYFYASLVMSILGLQFWSVFITLLMIKTLGEGFLIIPFLIHINRFNLLSAYPFLVVYYPFHFLFFALKGTFGSYKWK